MATELNTKTKNKIHPYKMVLYAGLGGIVMMFAGLTSAYIVKKSQANWLLFDLPNVFLVSTFVILLSSFTIQMALKKAKEGLQNPYRGFLFLTAILGLVFISLQVQGFMALEANNVALTGPRSNSAAFWYFLLLAFVFFWFPSLLCILCYPSGIALEQASGVISPLSRFGVSTQFVGLIQ